MQSPADSVGWSPSATTGSSSTSTLQNQAKDLLARPGHPVVDLVDPERVRQAAHRDAPVSGQAARRGLERTLDLAMWLDLCAPEVSLG